MRPKAKYKFIHDHREKYPIHAMCSFFKVSRSGYYAWLKQKDKPEADQALARLVAECHKGYRQTYGYRRVCLWLRRHKGIHRNPKTILRVMNKYGLLSQTRRKRKYRQMGDALHRYENILNRQFSAQEPNRKWVTDISYVPTPQGTLYLSIIRDL